ncbi:molybdopterin-synthase adenylyltransferase MoeB [Aliidiomarina quisquiliarum]|uniref:molybdopterin-synthase adenylyltransferase MoeB n=1 Tax=Aliidiomarina quisquiliarum TaxID=2938947 RepID=UPI00208F735E|nr:molybdopterin-synthase adenylyltransferase MoeB [Aliidiomarina quisquiliarum]MCO4322393.1 molybdopterin-synthase adenylyltransferase MoeB [Aliidiomarina quisquiliarum]
MTKPIVELTDAQSLRYARHIMLPSMDFEGQEKLLASHALVVGAGGLGCAVIPYLVASGVGTITIVDNDIIERSNLQRQILYREADLGALKASTAIKAVQHMNSDCQLQAITERITDDNIGRLFAADTQPKIDVIVDCTDNVNIRLCLNRYCFSTATPLVSGAAIRMEGQVAVYPMNRKTLHQKAMPCYRCFSHYFGEQQLTCMEAGVLSPLVGVVGTLQAVETLKVLTGIGTTLQGKVLLYDAAHATFHTMQLPKLTSCPVCALA